MSTRLLKSRLRQIIREEVEHLVESSDLFQDDEPEYDIPASDVNHFAIAESIVDNIGVESAANLYNRVMRNDQEAYRILSDYVRVLSDGMFSSREEVEEVLTALRFNLPFENIARGRIKPGPRF